MTIREIFKLAESLGVADKPIYIDYSCNDDWYDWCGNTNNKKVKIVTDIDGNVTILINNLNY